MAVTEAAGAVQGGRTIGHAHGRIEGRRSLEVRWILPGPLESVVADWFGRFPAEVAARQDAYLVDPELPGVSVKVRAGAALEVKVYHGSQGLLEMSGRALGRTESWQKWSFPFTSVSQDGGGLAGWRLVRKRRRIIRFQLAGGRVVAAVARPATEPMCAVELTEIDLGAEVYWSLAFEATGPSELLYSMLRDSAALMFAQAPPGQVDLGLDCCQSYARWLSRHQAPGGNTVARFKPVGGPGGASGPARLVTEPRTLRLLRDWPVYQQ